MGVTTLVTGNCGSSSTNVGEFLNRINQQPLAVNLATLIAHGSVRRTAMGLEDRAPTPEELKQMESLVEQSMKDGAVGLSTGLIYVPGTFAKTDEIVSLHVSRRSTVVYMRLTCATKATKSQTPFVKAFRLASRRACR